MAERRSPDELLTFPCTFEFKAFAATDEGKCFADAVMHAVGQVVPVGCDQVRVRNSSAGRYQCVTVFTRLENSTQLTTIYANLRVVSGLLYLV